MKCLNCGRAITSGDFCASCTKKLKDPSLKARLDRWDKNNLPVYKRPKPTKPWKK